jgi:amino acid permease
MPTEDLLSREEVLGGLPRRRAQTLLFLIEARTARLTTLSRQARELWTGERAHAQREQAFLEAFAVGREPSARPSIQVLERFATQWADLVPETPRMRAVLAHVLGQRHPVAYGFLPRIRSALGLDEESVRTAFQRQYGHAPERHFAARVSLLDRLSWWRSTFTRWLEELPPFWSAYALTLTETVGAGILALPIALAGIGPLAGVAILVALGLVNVLTIAFMAEATARHGAAHFGGAFVGRIVGHYLGSSASVVHGLATVVFATVCLHAYYLGFGTAMAEATRLPAPMFVGILFLIGLVYLRRGSMGATVASAMIVGVINLLLVLVLALLALESVQFHNLLYFDMPLVGGRPIEASSLGLVFGVVMTAYFGHVSVSNGAHFVLQRDPSGRSLLRGCAAAQGTTIVLYSLWVLAVGGAIPAEILLAERGTVLGPLADQVGPAVYVLGSLFALLGMGMVSIHYSLALFNLVRERLPRAMRGQFLIAGSPVALTFLLTEGLLLAGTGSFSGPLGALGVIVVSLLTGVFAVLLLASTRRKGDLVPGSRVGGLGHPVVLALVYLLAVGSMFVHGLIIWTHPLERAAALSAGLLTVGLTVYVAARGGFRPRVVTEVRRDGTTGDWGAFGMTAVGQPLTAVVRLVYPHGERRSLMARGDVPAFRSLAAVVFELPATRARELKVWVHSVSRDGYSEELPARVELVAASGMSSTLEPREGDRQMLSAIAGTPICVRINFPPSA